MISFKEYLIERIKAKMWDDGSVLTDDGAGNNKSEKPQKISIHPNKLVRHELRPRGLKYLESEKKIKSLTDAYKKGKSIPPIVVHRHHGPNGELQHKIINGHHRVEAARRAGITHLNAIVLNKGPSTIDQTEITKRYRKKKIK